MFKHIFIIGIKSGDGGLSEFVITEPLDLSPDLLAHIIFPGKPVPASIKRSRLGRIYNKRTPYIIAQKWRAKLLYRECPYEGAVRLEYLFGFEIPKSWPKYQQVEALKGGVPYIARPDADNLEKTYNDILKNIVFRDDSLIVKSTARKEYTEKAKTEVWIYYA